MYEGLRSEIASRLTSVWLDPFPIKRALWRLAYNWIAQREREGFSLMNLGYARKGSPTPIPPGEEGFCLELYHHVAEEVDLRDKALLEVGCGRGGGLSYLKRRFEPRIAMGIDLSDRAVDLARAHAAGVEGLEVHQGDAENLAFAPATFDAVLNIESSHCYPSRRRFFEEVHRVLTEEGVFLYADFFHARAIPEVVLSLRDAGFTLIKEEDITENVLLAMALDEHRRLELLRGVPALLRWPLRQFVGATDGWGHLGLSRGWLRYLFYVLRKDGSVGPENP